MTTPTGAAAPRPRDGRFLIVEDDPQVATLIGRILSADARALDTADTGASMADHMARQRYELVVLDLTLPDRDGLTLLRDRALDPGTGLVVVSGRTDSFDKVAALELGADDYVTKPFDPHEFRARVHSVLRRCRQVATDAPGNAGAARRRPAPRYQFDGWTLDMATRTLAAPDGTPVELTSGDIDVLEVLVVKAGLVLSRDALLSLLHGPARTPGDRSVDVRIRRLRAKIEADPDTPRLIKTVRGEGYCFTGLVAVDR